MKRLTAGFIDSQPFIPKVSHARYPRLSEDVWLYGGMKRLTAGFIDSQPFITASYWLEPWHREALDEAASLLGINDDALIRAALTTFLFRFAVDDGPPATVVALIGVSPKRPRNTRRAPHEAGLVGVPRDTSQDFVHTKCWIEPWQHEALRQAVTILGTDADAVMRFALTAYLFPFVNAGKSTDLPRAGLNGEPVDIDDLAERVLTPPRTVSSSEERNK